jgi:hypothetical protein
VYAKGFKDKVISKELKRGIFTKCESSRIKQFKASGKFLEGTIFTKLTVEDKRGEQVFWEIHCPKCSKDSLVQVGLCTGKFIGRIQDLKIGRQPCRCTKFNYTEDQLTFLVKEKIVSFDGKFLRIDNQHQYQSFHKVYWVCKNGTENNTLVTNLLYSGHQCLCCVKTFKRYRPNHLYLVKWITLEGFEFLKYGMTSLNSVEDRIKTQSDKTCCTVQEVLHVTTTDYSTAVRRERIIKNFFKNKGIISKGIFEDGSSETCEFTGNNIEYIVGVFSNENQVKMG